MISCCDFCDKNVNISFNFNHNRVVMCEDCKLKLYVRGKNKKLKIKDYKLLKELIENKNIKRWNKAYPNNVVELLK